MNRYSIVCRLRWPAILLLTGVIALLNQMGVLSWWHAWPLYLILFGVLSLAERAVLARDGGVVPPVYPYGAGFSGAGVYPTPAGYPPAGAGVPAPAAAAAPGTAMVPSAAAELNLGSTEPHKSWEEEGR